LRDGGLGAAVDGALDRDNAVAVCRNRPLCKKPGAKTGVLLNNPHSEQRHPMNPDYYEWICTAVEEKFGVTPEFVRAEVMLGLEADENPVVILNVGEHTAVAQVPDASGWAGVDRLLGDLEAELVRQRPIDKCRRVRHTKER
jgi:hypothetical protein